MLLTVTLCFLTFCFVLLLYFYYNNIDESDFLSQLWISVVPSKHIIFLTNFIIFWQIIKFYFSEKSQIKFVLMSSHYLNKWHLANWERKMKYVGAITNICTKWIRFLLQICLFQWNKQNCWFNLLLKIISQGRNSQRFLRQIHMIFVTLGLTILIFFKTESSFWSRYH